MSSTEQTHRANGYLSGQRKEHFNNHSDYSWAVCFRGFYSSNSKREKQEMEKEKRTKGKIPVILPGRVYGEITIFVFRLTCIYILALPFFFNEILQNLLKLTESIFSLIF